MHMKLNPKVTPAVKSAHAHVFCINHTGSVIIRVPVCGRWEGGKVMCIQGRVLGRKLEKQVEKT